MAMVQYYVLYKYIHPTAKKPITNTTTDKYDATTKFLKGYLTGTGQPGIDTAEILQQQSAENSKYDMLFMYNGVGEINSNSNLKLPTIATLPTMMAEKFDRCNGEPWFVASVHTSLPSAIKAATPIAKSIGKNSVKVVKNVPLEISVDIE